MQMGFSLPNIARCIGRINNKMEELIFCEECKYHKGKRYGIFAHKEECRAECVKMYNYRIYWREWVNPEQKNKENNCKDFKLHWYYKLFNWLS